MPRPWAWYAGIKIMWNDIFQVIMATMVLIGALYVVGIVIVEIKIIKEKRRHRKWKQQHKEYDEMW